MLTVKNVMHRTIYNRKGSSFISLFIALMIIGLMVWMLTRTNTQSEKRGIMKDAGIDTSSYKSMIDSARKAADGAAKPKQ